MDPAAGMSRHHLLPACRCLRFATRAVVFAMVLAIDNRCAFAATMPASETSDLTDLPPSDLNLLGPSEPAGPSDVIEPSWTLGTEIQPYELWEVLTKRPAGGGPQQCMRSRPSAELDGEKLEALLVDGMCPFLAAFFSSSSPLAQSQRLAVTERQLAAAFPDLWYVKVDADHLGIRAFLQWDVTFLPMYVLFTPSGADQAPKWHRWPGDGQQNPYDYAAVVAFVTRASGLIVANTSASSLGPVVLPRRGSTAWPQAGVELAIGWTIIMLVATRRLYRRWAGTAPGHPGASGSAGVPPPGSIANISTVGG
eukprot:gnl/TRDRNA2_/TRDRNA2_190946_c0_seq1.p1 gnl/TRDRNA2_/TRDRNA2_190946_c0~~gnl/TRDRNA2_/TRDRNA2_190946_c0_seq1.p1  ORF type:complete len:309 (-),score=26.70 gnl/TRDRNA2_/TRDRNA2_190946_c0_seq1:48-974(-)